MLVSLIVAVIQFLGFPTAWDKFFTLVGGIIILGIAYRMGPKVKSNSTAQSLPYVEYKREEVITIINQDSEITQ
jgi:hypothetical protein